MLVLHGKPTYLNKLSSICQVLKTQAESACDNARLLPQDLKHRLRVHVIMHTFYPRT